MHEEEVDGKRKKFRTDTGEIDIFAIRKNGTEYLVIELKKGRPSDRVVGQIQSYMGYIKDVFAKNDKKVKDLIIVLEDDLRLRRALKINPDIDFYRYQIRFDLKKMTRDPKAVEVKNSLILFEFYLIAQLGITGERLMRTVMHGLTWFGYSFVLKQQIERRV